MSILSSFTDIKILKTERSTEYPALNQIEVLVNAFEMSKGDYIFFLTQTTFSKKIKLKRLLSINL